MRRTLAVGDIHGGLKALKQVLKQAEVSSGDHLIFLGDYVDGWSESAQTVDFLMALSRKQNCTLLRGNHDALAEGWLKDGVANALWLYNGGGATLKSYTDYSPEHLGRHLRFYENLRDNYLDEKNRFFTHAGFQNRNGPESEFHSTAFYWDRTLWEMMMAMDLSLKKDDPRYPKRLTHHREIYIGHTPMTNYGITIPTNRANVWNVDTGAAFKGPISIIDVDSKEFWQSDPVWTLYPEEKGRNKFSYSAS